MIRLTFPIEVRKSGRVVVRNYWSDGGSTQSGVEGIVEGSGSGVGGSGVEGSIEGGDQAERCPIDGWWLVDPI